MIVDRGDDPSLSPSVLGRMDLEASFQGTELLTHLEITSATANSSTKLHSFHVMLSLNRQLTLLSSQLTQLVGNALSAQLPEHSVCEKLLLPALCGRC